MHRYQSSQCAWYWDEPRSRFLYVSMENEVILQKKWDSKISDDIDIDFWYLTNILKPSIISRSLNVSISIISVKLECCTCYIPNPGHTRLCYHEILPIVTQSQQSNLKIKNKRSNPLSSIETSSEWLNLNLNTKS